jgi:hypothetical protein
MTKTVGFVTADISCMLPKIIDIASKKEKLSPALKAPGTVTLRLVLD